ncbi:hypothetical protein D8B26_007898 [Coccidioides posadasii str. Silveira]|uniref:G2/mitotic-specific cyclin-B1 n=1 Tax=Coccidioides posadasii (strain RMSCC 757 / Silveira) TaxID=443226 RepID=E9D1N0_COCPS|nr:G2/mitotic-specific cyclin-B1 [Coccidioides posadasii str. Silveira]QVM13286.1 hypothetical protein D8B26_007898 [Coccidioides posadasii str. Silveira]
MDAKPQRPKALRVRGDENAPIANLNGKTLHQRNKSTPALSTLARADGAKEPLKRAALGNVSNTANILRLAKDDSFTVSAKEKLRPTEKLAAIARPNQRASQVSTTKILNKSTTADAGTATIKTTALDKLPVNARKPPTRRNTVVQESVLPALLEAAPSAADKNPSSTQAKHTTSEGALSSNAHCTSHDYNDASSIHAKEPKENSSVLNGTDGLQKVEGIYIEDNGEIKVYKPHNPAIRIPELSTEVKSGPGPAPDIQTSQERPIAGLVAKISEEEAMVPYAHHSTEFDPEETWDEDNGPYVDDGCVTARSQLYSTDNTTVNATTVLFPEISVNIKQELALAKQVVESTRAVQDYEEECSDPTMVAEYGDEIFDYMRKLEIKLMPNPHYMDTQAEIQWSMRSVLMDWIVQVHLRFNLLPETLFLCVNYIDRFLSCKIVSLGKLQLVGATAIFIAAKYEEINCPSVQEIVYMVDNGYTAEEILKAERFMLSLLQFELGWPGPMNFLRRISKADDYDLETRTLAKYFLEITIMDERFVGSPPSFVAAAAHCLARMMLRKGDWGAAHVHYSKYTYSQLYPVMKLMFECCDAPQRHHPAIYEKYSDRRFKRAASFAEHESLSGFQVPQPPQFPSNRLVSVHNHVQAPRRF